MAGGDGWGDLCAGWRFPLREKYKIPAVHTHEIIVFVE